ncbi:glycosyltransferase, partial [Bacillus spizizenii]|nr:glycosyltransferase [Bacillus spizizenii]
TYLRKLALPYRDHVIFTKFIPADDIPNLFLMADVFVCSSQWNEPLARVNYEAMAAGTPLITTNRGGNG